MSNEENIIEDEKPVAEGQDLGDKKKKGKVKEEKTSPGKELLSWVMVFVGAFVVAFVISHFLIINAKIPSESMVSTIKVGDKVIGNRLAYKFSDPQRGDIAMFWSPIEPQKIYIKRIIGLPGDTVTIDNNTVYINGKPIKENYVDSWTGNPEKYVYDPSKSQIVAINNTGDFNLSEYKIPEDEYFMMGDNRDHSNDSRFWGTVKRDKLIAKALFRWYPSIKSLTK